MPTVALNTYPANKLEPFMSPETARLWDVAIAPNLTIARGTVLGQITASGKFAPYFAGNTDGTQTPRCILAYDVITDGSGNVILSSQAGTNDVWTVSLGAPTAGTFTLTYNGQTTAGIAYNASAATVQTALQGLSTIGAGNVTVTGANGGPYTVTFVGALASQASQTLTGSGAGLTAGTFAITHTTTGAPAALSGGDLQQTIPAVPAYYKGCFACPDLVNLDANAVTGLGGHLLNGTVTTGVLQFA